MIPRLIKTSSPPHEALLNGSSPLFNIKKGGEELLCSAASFPQDAVWCSSVWNTHSLLTSPPATPIEPGASTAIGTIETTNTHATCTELRVEKDTNLWEVSRHVK
jgi:hypothetical protein